MPFSSLEFSQFVYICPYVKVYRNGFLCFKKTKISIFFAMRGFIKTSVVVLLFLLSETRFSSGPKPTNALTDTQRKEIEDLRAKLDEAFEKDEEKTLKAHGIIVQPEWTQNSDTQLNTKSKVVVTKSGLDEAKALRDEISKAIKQDQYVVVGSTDQLGHNTQIIQELHNKYVGNENNRKSKVGDMVSLKIPSNEPNLVEVSSSYDEPGIDIRKLQRLELTKRRTRETLILESIEEDLNFNLGKKVQEWEHIIHGGQEFFIGRLDEDLQIVHKNALHYEASETVHIGAHISYLETYTFWNPEQQHQEGIIIVATGNQVLWYRADEKSAQIVLYWQWVVGSAISGLTYFAADSMDYLVVSSNQSLRAGYYALNIYQFDLKNKEFWITQRLQLAHPCNEVTFLNTGRDYLLAVPQNNTAMIYTFNPHTEATTHVHFQLKHKFNSEGIQFITAFQMGGRSYLALGGMQPKILLYQQGEFLPRTIFGNNFGLVEFFFPIPVRTYRDDLILLVQHRVDFGTHKLTVLETLIWDGEAFEATIPAPCKLGLHIVHGVNCMLDIQRDAGLKGAALLRRGDEVSVIVPRHEAESGLFRLHTKLLAKNSELKDLQEMFDFLREWVAEQDELIAVAETFLSKPMDINEPNFEKLKLLKTPELFFNGAIKELYVNDYKWTSGDSTMDLNHVMDEIEQLEHELSLSRHKRDADERTGHSGSFESLDFDEIEAEFLEMESLNGDHFYVRNGQLDFSGLLKLAELEVLESEHLSEGHQAMLKELTLEKDLEFERINGIAWQDIAQNLVFYNTPFVLDVLEVQGDVIVEKEIDISRLNSLKFPEDYLWTEGVQNPIINAKKTFTGILSANHVDTEGYINNKNPFDIITLSDKQDWAGIPTFAHLEVSEILELNGTARGRGVEEFPRNPSLEETNFITANCEFSNLKVMGPVIIERDFNNEPLYNTLSDIIQRPEDPNEEIQIPSKKIFSNVEFPIDFHILDNKINDIAIDQFIPSQSFQELGLQIIDGYIYFGNLTITGSYDGVLIDELIKNTIRIDIPQNLTNTQLKFVNPIEADTVNIRKTLNGVYIAKGYQTVNEDIVTPKAYFQTLKTVECNILGDIKGTSKFNDIDLIKYLETKNSSKSMEKSKNIFLNELILEDGLQVDEIHGLKTESLYKFLDCVDTLPEMVLDGKVHIDRITVSGDVQVNKLNGQDFDNDIQLMAIWLDRPNYLSTKLQFVDIVDLKGPLNVLGNYNNENLPELIDDMVFRNLNGTVMILAPKKFTGHVQVLGNTELDALNGIPFNEYANKHKTAIFEGSLQINGNLIVRELMINGTLNDFPISELNNQIRYDKNLQAFILKGVTNLSKPLNLHDLTVFGDLNQFNNLGYFFENLIYKKGNCVLNGNYNFTGRVTIEHGAYIAYLNDHNLMDILNDITYINGLEPLIIASPIRFTSPIKTSLLNVKGALKSNNLNGCSIKSWLDDTLNVGNEETITKSLHFATGSLHGNSFLASFLNDIDLSKIITLNTRQNLTNGLKFSKVYLDGIINVGGPINGVDLQAEFENTLLTTGNQHIQTPLTIHNVNILKNLETNKPINGDKNLGNVATLHEDIEFESPFYFEELRTQNIITEDLISGIDFSEWYKFALWKKGRSEHRISGNWSIGSLSLKNGPSMPEFVNSNARVMSGERSFHELCYKLKELLMKYSKRSYALKYLRKSFELSLKNIEEETEIHKAFKIEEYLLVNLDCNSSIFKWNSIEKKYELIANFTSGLIDQIAIANDRAARSQIIKFTTNSYEQKSENCSFVGLNLWKLSNNKVVHMKHFNENVTEIWAASLKDYLFAITDEGLKRISTTMPYSIQSLDLDASLETENYSIIGKTVNSKILYDNGTHFAQMSQDSSLNKRQRRAVPLGNDIFTKYPRTIHTLSIHDESILKPNATLVQKLTFSDFSNIIERILEDLDYRLGIEINITKLSIYESDLYDSHLIQDFIAIIEQLNTQEIYPPHTFNDIKLESINISENPAQALAARIVQIVWPVIVEIDEIHRYLRGNSTTEHPACACILNYLGLAIKEVLEIANTPIENLEYADPLNAVINRIRQFQIDLKALETELKLEIAEDLNAEIENEIQNDYKMDSMSSSSNYSIKEDNKGYNNTSLKIQKFKKTSSPERSELLNLEVGAELFAFNLLAITRVQSHQTPGVQPGGIYIYINILENDLFQFIPAYKPRSMATLRIRDITLLAYVENCCTVNVLQYRGVEGFVKFAKFTSNNPVKHIISLSLSHADYGQRHYFVTILNDKLIFYEAVFIGLKEVPGADRLDCN